MFLLNDYKDGEVKLEIIEQLYRRALLFPYKYLFKRPYPLLMGFYYGYPDCCIKEYADGFMEHKPMSTSFDGFFPCKVHIGLIDKDFTPDMLITERVCCKPFGGPTAFSDYVSPAISETKRVLGKFALLSKLYNEEVLLLH